MSAIAVYTVATVWTMEMFSGKWKTIFGFVISLAWTVAKYATKHLTNMCSCFLTFFYFMQVVIRIGCTFVKRLENSTPVFLWITSIDTIGTLFCL